MTAAWASLAVSGASCLRGRKIGRELAGRDHASELRGVGAHVVVVHERVVLLHVRVGVAEVSRRARYGDGLADGVADFEGWLARAISSASAIANWPSPVGWNGAGSPSP